MPIKLSKNLPYEKILLVVGDRIGDTIFSIPAVHLLKNSLPEIKFDAMVFSKAAEQVLMHNPDIHNVHVSNKAAVNYKITQQYPLTINLIYELEREKKFFKIPTNNYLSIGKQDLTKHRALQIWEFVRDLLETPLQESSQQYMLYPQEQDRQSLLAKLHDLSVTSNDILIGIQLGCHRVAQRGWKIWNAQRHRHKKVWGIENYIALANALRELVPNSKLILTGAKSESFLAKMFKKQVPWATDLIGKTSVHELAILMDLVKVYITHDTGSLHIACARQTPLVTLFANTATPVAFTGPFPIKPHYCVINKENMSDITVKEVLDAVMKKLSPGYGSN